MPVAVEKQYAGRKEKLPVLIVRAIPYHRMIRHSKGTLHDYCGGAVAAEPGSARDRVLHDWRNGAAMKEEFRDG
ncbi:MAG: hypothetical protein E6230_26590 [Paenibacillus dendritiformis]|uniref:hypothetical protein n=1 Tax=Paenibacillus dendritiformis TaxID=130049 RepID=UPI001B1591A0|nr:hypothetical protein [Paenibacillus dendritiformis]MDU5145744.1 hypothetical protein [Paenibacillus dendritiformis]GIO75710.1 hypothetical protein J27TS7_52240 [Paenibacillus dendritiformis]